MRPIYDVRIAHRRQRQSLIAFAAGAAHEGAYSTPTVHRANASRSTGWYTSVALMVVTFAATLLTS